ncbi:TPA: FMN-binding glutamate synthase family protein [Staphylococcus aureus]|nr:FMN-binding glutamate synthase family protein [Staphylococcus aureus]
MTFLTVMQFIVNIIVVGFMLTVIVIGLIWLIKDKRQSQHSVLRNYPLLARIRYISEKMGPELRQYLFSGDNEGKPFSRNDYKNIVLAGKYNSRMTSFGTTKDYQDGFYIQNTMFPMQRNEISVDNTTLLSTFIYKIANERLFSREEYRVPTKIDPYYLSDDHAIKLGEHLKHPKEGNFSEGLFKEVAQLSNVRAFELKLAQGAKTRGGHMEAEKVNEEIAKIRNVEPYKTINSPNRYEFIHNAEDLIRFVDQLQQLGQKPVGFKIVVSKVSEIETLVRTMVELDKYPSFITIDGGEGGTGATFQELQDGVGLPLFTALPIVSGMLEKYGIRDKVKLAASGKLVTPDKIAIALGLGADFVNIARGMMISVGCIMSQQCHMNTCPVGVATTDAKKEKALIVGEKQYRVTNYVTSLHEGLFNIAAAVGVSSPTEITADHIVYRKVDGELQTIHDYKLKLIS